MEAGLQFFRAYEGWIYFLVAFGALIYLRRFMLAWTELRGSLFGLERENAQRKLNMAASVLVMLILVVVAEFVLTSFVVPSTPAANPLLTPTIDLLATPTITLAAPTAPAPGFGSPATVTPLPTIDEFSETCVPGQIEITAPEAGDTLSDEVSILGSANIPNFGFYKIEIATLEASLQADTVWLSIQAGNNPKQNETLVETWNVSSLTPGEYVLQLVVTDNDGQQPAPECRIRVRIAGE